MKRTKKNKAEEMDLNQEPEEIRTDEADATQEERDDYQDEVAELKDKYLRLFAEFDNFKKRTTRERLELMTSASQDLLTALLPVMDDFDRARKNTEEQQMSDNPLLEGYLLVYNKLAAILRSRGLEEMTTTGEAFDPEMHEAITEIPMPDMKGKIIDTVEKGYRLGEKIIRFPKVVVGA